MGLLWSCEPKAQTQKLRYRNTCYSSQTMLEKPCQLFLVWFFPHASRHRHWAEGKILWPTSCLRSNLRALLLINFSYTPRPPQLPHVSTHNGVASPLWKCFLHYWLAMLHRPEYDYLLLLSSKTDMKICFYCRAFVEEKRPWDPAKNQTWAG